MNSFELLREVAAEAGLEAFPDVYQGDDLDRWAVYTLEQSYGAHFRDNYAGYATDDLQLNVYLPINTNFFDLMNTIRASLIAHGFDSPEITTVPLPDQRLRELSFSTSRTYEV